MQTGLKDIQKRELKLNDTIAMCGWNYDLRDFGKHGKEYWFATGKVFFHKGKITWTGVQEFEHKIFDENFIIIKRDGKRMVKVEKEWNDKKMNVR